MIDVLQNLSEATELYHADGALTSAERTHLADALSTLTRAYDFGYTFGYRHEFG